MPDLGCPAKARAPVPRQTRPPVSYSRLRCYAGLSPERRAEIGAELVGLVASGDFVTPVEARYPLEGVRQALEDHERTGRRGKILLVSPVG